MLLPHLNMVSLLLVDTFYIQLYTYVKGQYSSQQTMACGNIICNPTVSILFFYNLLILTIVQNIARFLVRFATRLCGTFRLAALHSQTQCHGKDQSCCRSLSVIHGTPFCATYTVNATGNRPGFPGYVPALDELPLCLRPEEPGQLLLLLQSSVFHTGWTIGLVGLKPVYWTSACVYM